MTIEQLLTEARDAATIRSGLESSANEHLRLVKAREYLRGIEAAVRCLDQSSSLTIELDKRMLREQTGFTTPTRAEFLASFTEDALSPADDDTLRVSWRSGDDVLGPHVGAIGFAETMLLMLESEAYGVALEPAAILNGTTVPIGHRFAVLDCEGETLGTGPTQVEAMEAACVMIVQHLRERNDELLDRLQRVNGAVQVLLSGGEQ